MIEKIYNVLVLCTGNSSRSIMAEAIINTVGKGHFGLGAALIAAAFEAVDSTPMEGFDANALDTLLQLRERGLRSVAILPLGYREVGKDWLDGLKKVRRPREAFITEIR